eukprot:NODE_1072_length_1724_cov_9.347463_g948_i0.p1 GENE.NODE_1072_length_1724_cov_9.347463_g948_i0~~NODE_1072_length_1724_cov_9.347463_g948_i0.p1  ORF type:complete len:492 (-),score=56.54 NODE_1072_length_1724_cov_9.347463_g948_i0:100-1575(-)
MDLQTIRRQPDVEMKMAFVVLNDGLLEAMVRFQALFRGYRFRRRFSVAQLWNENGTKKQHRDKDTRNPPILSYGGGNCSMQCPPPDCHAERPGTSMRRASPSNRPATPEWTSPFASSRSNANVVGITPPPRPCLLDSSRNRSARRSVLSSARAVRASARAPDADESCLSVCSRSDSSPPDSAQTVSGTPPARRFASGASANALVSSPWLSKSGEDSIGGYITSYGLESLKSCAPESFKFSGESSSYLATMALKQSHLSARGSTFGFSRSNSFLSSPMSGTRFPPPGQSATNRSLLASRSLGSPLGHLSASEGKTLLGSGDALDSSFEDRLLESETVGPSRSVRARQQSSQIQPEYEISISAQSFAALQQHRQLEAHARRAEADILHRRLQALETMEQVAQEVNVRLQKEAEITRTLGLMENAELPSIGKYDFGPMSLSVFPKVLLPQERPASGIRSNVPGGPLPARVHSGQVRSSRPASSTNQMLPRLGKA